MPLSRLLEAIEGFRAGGARATAWSVYGVETRRLSLGTRDEDTGGPHTPLAMAESFGAHYLVVWSDGRVSSGEIDRSEIDAGPEEVLARALLAAYEDPDAAQVAGPATMPEVAIHDDAVAATALGNSGPLLARLAPVRRLVAEHGFRVWSGSMAAAEARGHVVTSAGLDAATAGTLFEWYVSFDGEIGDGFRGRAEDAPGEFQARLARLADLVSRLRRTAACAPSGRCPVILHPNVVESFVFEILLENLHGAAVAHGESHFRPEQFGSRDPVLRPDLTLRADPLEPLKAGSYRFTREGVPAAPCVFMDRGCLRTPVLNLKYARRLGRPPTALPLGYDTLHLEGPEPLSLGDALAEADGGALVLDLLGVHTLDATSGDFSLAAPQALLVERGGVGGRIRPTLSGNLFEALRSHRLALVRFDGFDTPGLLFRCRLS